MKIKTFTGKNYKEALELVKREFGADAVILETEEVRDIEFMVKITAAIDFEKMGNEKRDVFSSYIESELISMKDSQITNDDLKKEIREIKEMLYEIKNQGRIGHRAHYDLLKQSGLREEFIENLLNEEECNDVFEKLSSEIKAGYRLSNGKTIMLAGPTGVGKTTTIIKLASFAIKIGKKVGIMNLDSFRLGAFEQIRVFCQLLGIPFVSVNNVEEFKDLYSDFAKDKNIVFIDTTGHNPKDRRYINELSKIKENGLPLEVHLTVSLSMREDIFIKAKDNYQSLGIDYIIFTKLDESYNFGSIYNIFKTYNKPISYLTNGQRIPNDIQAVSPVKLTNIILGRGLIQ